MYIMEQTGLDLSDWQPFDQEPFDQLDTGSCNSGLGSGIIIVAEVGIVMPGLAILSTAIQAAPAIT